MKKKKTLWSKIKAKVKPKKRMTVAQRNRQHGRVLRGENRY